MKKLLLILGLSLIFDVAPCKADQPDALQDNHETQNIYNALLRRHSHGDLSEEVHGKCRLNFFCGPKGPKGAKGPRGHRGKRGHTGPTGPTGPEAQGNFISLFTLDSDMAHVSPSQNVPFNHPAAQHGSIGFIPPSTITISEAGTYKVTFGLAVSLSLFEPAPNQSFVLQINGHSVLGGKYNNGNIGPGGLSGLTIDIVITAADLISGQALLTIQHTNTTNPSLNVLLQSSNGVDTDTTTPPTAAFIEVHQIS